MNNKDIHEILEEAAADAKEAYIYNLYRQPVMRMSRAGLPLIQLALEDFVLPKLPTLECDYIREVTKQSNRLKSYMAVGVGFLYEKAIAGSLAVDYPDADIQKQVKLDYLGISGTCDFLAIEDKTVRVIECKALNVKTLTEAKEKKLMVDNWGYRSQLLLYLAAAQLKFPEHKCQAEWRLWAKQSSHSFTFKPSFTDIENELSHINRRCVAYTIASEAFVEKNYTELIDVLSIFDDALPVRDFMYSNLSNSCSFHFSPWSDLVVDKDGLLLLEWKDNVLHMLNYISSPTSLNRRKLITLLNETNA